MPVRLPLAKATTALIALALAACSGHDEHADHPPQTSPDGITVTPDFVQRPTGASSTTAGFLHITAGQSDALVAASSTSAESIEIHTMEIDGNVMRMRPVSQTLLPAGEEVVFNADGLHLMIFGLSPSALDANLIDITLKFETAAPMTVYLPISDAGPHDHGHGHDH